MSVFEFYVGKIGLLWEIDGNLGGRERSWGLPPPPRGHPPGCDSAVLPVYRNGTVVGFLVQVIPNASHCAPSPSGDWWRKRGAAG